MFTDSDVTPLRLEILLDTLRAFRGGLEQRTLSRLLQPEPLTTAGTRVAGATFSAAEELGLVEKRSDKVALAAEARSAEAPAAIRSAFDRVVLTATAVEPHFALYFSYLLGLGKALYAKRPNKESWVNEYRTKVDNVPNEPFNKTSLSGFDRWYDYIGLGWYDPADNFQPQPYDRLERTLPVIFGKTKRLESDEFMTRLARHCPELDGGTLFRQANRGYDGDATRVCTLGLSHALIELDHVGVLRLFRPGDSSGWSINDAEPQREAHPDRAGSRITTIELLTRA
jgi:hypothetical protein